MKRTTPPKRKKPANRRRTGARSARARPPAPQPTDDIPDDAPPAGWAGEPEPPREFVSDSLWDWEEEEIDYAQDIELEQYALRVLRGERND